MLQVDLHYIKNNLNLNLYDKSDSLTEERRAQIKQAFDLFDKDHNGFITSSELGSVFDQLGHKQTEEELKKMVRFVHF